mmetsp:Transcript_14516/g.38309  ORF Transcript_14516/g.38309 Transcript_14516/m.38309 type:complete len:214 (+) Transcript_14516:485-1126(+)
MALSLLQARMLPSAALPLLQERDMHSSPSPSVLLSPTPAAELLLPMRDDRSMSSRSRRRPHTYLGPSASCSSRRATRPFARKLRAAAGSDGAGPERAFRAGTFAMSWEGIGSVLRTPHMRPPELAGAVAEEVGTTAAAPSSSARRFLVRCLRTAAAVAGLAAPDEIESGAESTLLAGTSASSEITRCTSGSSASAPDDCEHAVLGSSSSPTPE